MVLSNQRQDLRSLAVFRILLGLYIVYDIISRLKHGRLSLLWYTSSSSSEASSSSFLHPNDTPHKSPIHQIWFYRGSEAVQLACFAATAVLALTFALGYRCNVYTKTLLWLSVTAMQCRNMHVHDGSDTYVRHLLLWSCQIPELMSHVWSIDGYTSERHGNAALPNTMKYTAPIWGLRLQMVLMYFGTVLNRTTDRYGFSIATILQRSLWMPPKLLAVHYSLNSSFASRDCWLGNLVRTTLPLSRFMTACAMILEGIVPFACLGLGNRAISIIPAALLCSLHFGLLVLINLPNWQFAAMLATTVWIPTAFWNSVLPSNQQHEGGDTTAKRKKDDDHAIEEDDDTATPISRRQDDESITSKVTTKVSQRRPYLTYFFIFYMVYNFCGERGWIRKHDGGDIGEFLRISQYWVMFGTPPMTSVHTIFVGATLIEESDKSEVQIIDVWEWIKSRTAAPMNLEARQAEIWSNMTHVYPTPRWERIFDQWGQRKDRKRARYFMTQLCRYDSNLRGFQNLTLVWQHLRVMPPNTVNDEYQRYQKSGSDTVIQVDCRI